MLLVALVCLPLLALDLLRPLNGDSDIYQTMGAVLVEHGALPYVGTWDQNFPGIVYVHATAILLFGKSTLGFRLFELIWQVGVCCLLYRVSRDWLGTKASVLSALLYAMYYVASDPYLQGQRDGFAALFLLGAFALLQNSRRQGVEVERWFGAGVLIGAALLFRPTFLDYIVLFPLAKDAGKLSWRKASAAILGAAVLPMLALVPYAFIANGLHEVYLATIRFNSDVYTSYRQPLNFKPLLTCGLWLLCLGNITSATKFQRSSLYFLALGLLLGLANVLVMGKFAVYHFLPLFLILSPLAARGVMNVIPFGAPSLQMYFAILVVGIMLRLEMPWYIVKPFATQLHHGVPMALQETYDATSVSRDEDRVAEYLRLRTKPSDFVQVCSMTAGIQWKVDRPSPSRFTMVHPLVMHPDQPLLPYQLLWQKEFLMDLTTKRPAFIVLGCIDGLPWTNGRPLCDEILQIDGVKALLANSYTVDTSIGAFKIYKRNG